MSTAPSLVWARAPFFFALIRTVSDWLAELFMRGVFGSIGLFGNMWISTIGAFAGGFLFGLAASPIRTG